jgi:hypothetical protein
MEAASLSARAITPLGMRTTLVVMLQLLVNC